jgi:hypothetical protein
MESAIDAGWNKLYANNQRVQAFAVCKDSAIVWQTSNWNLVEEIQAISSAPEQSPKQVTANGLKYERLESSPDSFIGKAANDQGYFLMARVKNNIWVLAWATSDSVPELTLIDLQKTAIDLKDSVW